MKQTTLANRVSCTGIGLHSGKQVQLTLRPAVTDSGIIFKRLDVEAAHSIVPARYDLVVDTRLGTTIRNSFGVSVSTIEHIMAALWGAGIDNALIELDGPEVPIMDGSSEPFVFLIECAGVVQQARPRRMIKILKPVEVTEGKSTARIEPNVEGEEGCVLSIAIDFDNAVIRHQRARYDFRDTTFKQALSRARTFGFDHEVEALQKQGLALGGSLDNAIVVSKDGVLNEGGLRYDDEFVRHKALDCLGDLFLAGLRIDGSFTFNRPGHGINNLLLRALLADSTAYTVTDPDALPDAVIAASSETAAYA
ncbi:MAG: UDP-3-O-acyl-N-acetylglucosamine deacetylase [Alphaproteobacteria bacterium]